MGFEGSEMILSKSQLASKASLGFTFQSAYTYEFRISKISLGFWFKWEQKNLLLKLTDLYYERQVAWVAGLIIGNSFWDSESEKLILHTALWTYVIGKISDHKSEKQSGLKLLNV